MLDGDGRLTLGGMHNPVRGLLPGGSEVQLGVVMSLIGAPFFFALLYSMRRQVT